MDKLTKEQTYTAIIILLVFFIELIEGTAHFWFIAAAIALILAAWHFRK